MKSEHHSVLSNFIETGLDCTIPRQGGLQIEGGKCMVKALVVNGLSVGMLESRSRKIIGVQEFGTS